MAKNNKILQTLILGGIGIYALNKLLTKPAVIPPSPGNSPPGYALTGRSNTRESYPDFVSDNSNNSEPYPLPAGEEPNTGLTPKQRPQPEPRPIPPPPPAPKNKAKGNISGVLGNLFSEVISKIAPPETAIFYYSEKDVLDNERIFIKKMTHENRALCRAYLQWPARNIRKNRSRKIFY